MALMRLQKALAAAGVASRRRAEELITDGRVRVNGRVVTELGTKTDPQRDKIEVNGRVVVSEEPVVLLMNKPRGVICTVNDPEGRQTVLDLVRHRGARLFPVGRLDYDTSGALLLTNDGELAYALTHPKQGVAKTYLVKVRGQVSEDVLQQWRTGVDIGDRKKTAPAEAFRKEQNQNYTWLEVTLREGRNRQIRRMAEATGLMISKLKRVSFANISIARLRIGECRPLTDRELFRLKRDHVNPSGRQAQHTLQPVDETTRERSVKSGRQQRKTSRKKGRSKRKT